MPNTPKTKWDEKWKDKWNNDDFISDFSVELDPEKIRDFIRQTLQEELSLLEEKYNKFSHGGLTKGRDWLFKKEVLNILRQHKEELK